MEQTDNNQTNTGVAQESGNVVIDQLVDKQEGTTPPADKQGEADTATQTTAADSDVKDEADKGAVTRLQQELAQNNKVLEALGIDPKSDVAERFNAGLIGKQELLENAGITIPQKPPEVSAPQGPEQKLADLINKVKKEGASQEDFIEGLEAIQEGLKETKVQSERDLFNQNLNQCAQVTTDVIADDEMHKSLPADLQEVETQMFLSSTDNLVLREAQKSKNPQSYVNPGAYGFYAQKNAERLGKLRDHWIEYGRRLQRGDQTPRGSTNINPVSPSVGSGPTIAPPAKVNRDNWRQAAENWADKQGVV